MTRVLKSLFGKRETSAASTRGEPLHLTMEVFEATINADMPVLVDFWAPWCGPCHMIAPAVEDMAAEYEGRAVIAKMNTDENREIVGRLGIMGIPTLVVFKNGREVDRLVGYAPRHVLREKLDAALNFGG